jgi:sulfur carrier protein
MAQTECGTFARVAGLTPLRGGSSIAGMLIQVNGVPREVPEQMTVLELLADLGWAERRVAVERNGEIVPRSTHGEVMVAAGDRLEIIQAVGGG